MASFVELIWESSKAAPKPVLSSGFAEVSSGFTDGSSVFADVVSPDEPSDESS